MPRVSHLEIEADDVERAIAFYSNAFGWHAQCMDTEGNVFGMMQEDESAGL